MGGPKKFDGNGKGIQNAVQLNSSSFELKKKKGNRGDYKCRSKKILTRGEAKELWQKKVEGVGTGRTEGGELQKCKKIG